VYLSNNDPHVAGASRYGQHLQHMVTLQYLRSVAVTVYVLLISTSTERTDQLWSLAITAVLDIDISVYYDSSRVRPLHLVRIHGQSQS